MNLHGIVRGAVGTVNPETTGTWTPSLTGPGSYTTAPDGTLMPRYAAPITVPMQVQALEQRDLMHLDSLNIQGCTHKLYMTGQLRGLVRAAQDNGDLITLANGQQYKVTAILEGWPDWTCSAVTLQRN
jgi:hypothetical protein